MPTDLGDPFDITWRGAPQQMLPSDVPLWHRYLDAHANEFLKFYYNVRVGGPDVSKLEGDETLKRMWYLNTAKRIDVIAEGAADLWIIEVASSPYLRAVGQCLSYLYLWNLDPKIDKPAKMVLLCYYLDSDLEKVLTHHGVSVIAIDREKLKTYL
jgi:hypothetical protein